MMSRTKGFKHDLDQAINLNTYLKRVSRTKWSYKGSGLFLKPRGLNMSTIESEIKSNIYRFRNLRLHSKSSLTLTLIEPDREIVL